MYLFRSRFIFVDSTNNKCNTDLAVSSTNFEPEQGWEIMALFEIENLHVRFDAKDGPIYAVNGVDLSIEENTIIAMVGELSLIHI